MSAVSADLLEIIIELQSLPSLQHSFLGGGTNLAIRYNHRESVDIDLFWNSWQSSFSGNRKRGK